MTFMLCVKFYRQCVGPTEVMSADSFWPDVTLRGFQLVRLCTAVTLEVDILSVWLDQEQLPELLKDLLNGM